MIEELRRRVGRLNGLFLPLMVRTPRSKNSFHEILQSLLKEDYNECKYLAWMDNVHREVQVRLK
jgi:hypothetical protein